MDKTIDIIIPIYYCDTSLFIPIETCLSTLKTCYPQINIIAIDDCSPLDCSDHWNITETNVVNEGYVATVNKGLKLSTADIIIVANDDLTFHLGCLDRFFTLPDNVIASPADSASGDLETFGAIFGFTRKTFETMGYLNDKFKNFYSDEDYYKRALEKGVQVIKWKDIVIDHQESATFKALGNKDELINFDFNLK